MAWGTSSHSSSSRLGISSPAMLLKPVRLPPGRARLKTRPAPTGSPTPVKTIGIVEVALFAARVGVGDVVGGQCRQPIVVALRRAVFHRHVLSFDVAALAQSLPERSQIRIRGGGCAASSEVADHRHRLLLRMRGQRPRRCAAEQRHKIAAPHLRSSRPR